MRGIFTLFRSLPVPYHGLFIVLLHTPSMIIHIPQPKLSINIALTCRLPIPAECFLLILLNLGALAIAIP